MSRWKSKPILLFCGLFCNFGSATFAQDASIFEANDQIERAIESSVVEMPLVRPSTARNYPRTKLASQSPTITVRPADGQSGFPNDCRLQFEPVGPPNENRFRVNLTIPESVEIVDIIPQQPSDPGRRVRVTIDHISDSTVPLLDQNDRIQITNLPSIASNVEQSRSFKSNPFFSQEANVSPTPATAMQTARNTFQLPAASVQTNSNQFKTASSAKANDFAPALPVATSMVGPRSLETGVVVEFEIVLTNNSDLDFSDVLVQLQLPPGFKTTVFDRTAWVDEARQTASWRIPNLNRQQIEIIRYAVTATVAGKQQQKVTVGIDGTVQGETEFETLVSPPFESNENDDSQTEVELPSEIEPADRSASNVLHSVLNR